MSDRFRARTVLAVLLILLTIAGIHAAGPAVSLGLPARRTVLVIGAAAEAAFACLLIALHWRRTIPDPGAGDIGARLRSKLAGMLTVGLIAIPVAILFTSGLRFHHTEPPRSLERGRHRIRLLPPVRGGAADLLIVQQVLIAALLVAIIVAAIIAWRRRRSRLARPHGPVSADLDTPADLATAVESGRIALRELDDARAAIIACYVAMELSLAEAGAARDAAETPDELLARAVTGGLVGDAPASRLTALFYEARFSSHPMPMSQRDQAARALDDLAATLPADRQASR
jgi:Domain of unknown function (DUF4129)